jgi:putative DNA primase/helicase
MEDGTKLATALLKDMTSGDESMTARKLYENNVEFTPEFTPFIAANHLPKLDAFDEAMWNRIYLVPFHAVIAEKDKNTSRGIAGRDGDLGELLLEEAPGILAWAVRGCLDWLKNGLRPPTEVLMATNEYRADMDTFADWLGEVIDARAEAKGNLYPGPDLGLTALRDNYNTWARANLDDYEPLSQRIFKRYMAASGCKQDTDGTKRFWVLPEKRKPKINFAELSRLGALHEPTPEEIAVYEAENAAIDEEDQQRAIDGGYPSVEAMYEHERLQREAEAS